jgi:crotonobetainyl-CoA:carnitine CoA-transferase CaiB-like acyl-CoA transferase
MASGPLDGIRVLEFTQIIAGPFGCQNLADMGAEVIKVEPPGGEPWRLFSQFMPGESKTFQSLNRGKKSLVLSMQEPDAQQIVHRLIPTIDVVVINYRPDVPGKLGIDYETLSRIRPNLIYVDNTAWGRRGPWALRPGYDIVAQAVSGLMIGEGKVDPNGAPLSITSTAIADYGTGVAIAWSVCAALFHRERTGEGQSVEIPMFETMAQMVLSDHMYGHGFVPPQGDTGYPRMLSEDRRPYRTRDGHVCALVYTDKQWRAFFELIGRPGVMDSDPRFASLNQRTEHIHVLYAMVAEAMLTRTTAEWIEALESIDIPVMPMNSIESLMADPHLRAVGLLQAVEHPTEGTVMQLGVPSTWSRTQPGVRRPAPRAGEHGREILGSLGYTPQQIEALAAAGTTRLPRDEAGP